MITLTTLTATWSLIIYVSKSSGIAISSVPGFSDKATCEKAIPIVREMIKGNAFVERYTCVSTRGDEK